MGICVGWIWLTWLHARSWLWNYPIHFWSPFESLYVQGIYYFCIDLIFDSILFSNYIFREDLIPKSNKFCSFLLFVHLEGMQNQLKFIDSYTRNFLHSTFKIIYFLFIYIIYLPYPSSSQTMDKIRKRSFTNYQGSTLLPESLLEQVI